MKQYDIYKLKHQQVGRYLKENNLEELYWKLVEEKYGVRIDERIYNVPYLALRKNNRISAGSQPIDLPAVNNGKSNGKEELQQRNRKTGSEGRNSD